MSKVDFQEFLRRARETHGERYDYSKSESDYTTFKGNRVPIICHDHGVFMQEPSKHAYRGAGCPICAGNSPVDFQEFLRRARETHGERYDYSKSANDYYGYKESKVIVICRKHGEFRINPSNHILRSQGCQICYLESRNKKLDFSNISGKLPDIDWEGYVTSNENAYLEFKAGIWQAYNRYTGEIENEAINEIGIEILAQEVAAFLNMNGGILIVGVWENPGNPSEKIYHGIDLDIAASSASSTKKPSVERYLAAITSSLNRRLTHGHLCDTNIDINVFEYQGKEFLGLAIKSLAPEVTFYKKGEEEILYIREAAGKKPIKGKRMIDFCLARRQSSE